MSMLGRFRKSGGFYQLLLLIESCDPARQKSLLELVGTEDPGWANLLKIKCLTIERVLSWPEDALREIFSNVPEKIIASLYSGLDPELQEKVIKTIPFTRSREVFSLIQALDVGPAGRVAAAIKVVQTARELEAKGRFRFVTFAPDLALDLRLAG